MGLGIIGSKRISDHFDVRTTLGKGTTVTVWLPGPATRTGDDPARPIDEILARERETGPPRSAAMGSGAS